jgi:hypothetical protein
VRISTYSCVSDELDAILLAALLNWPLPVDLHSVDDPVLVEVVDGGGLVAALKGCFYSSPKKRPNKLERLSLQACPASSNSCGREY